MKNLKEKSSKALRTAQYKSTFLSPTAFVARTGKTVYISEEFHKKLSLLVFMLGGGGLNLSDYMQNLLKHHFEDYKEEIKEIYKNTDKPLFQLWKF